MVYDLSGHRYVPVFNMGVSDVYYCDECGRPFDESDLDLSRLWDAMALWVALQCTLDSYHGAGEFRGRRWWDVRTLIFSADQSR